MFRIEKKVKSLISSLIKMGTERDLLIRACFLSQTYPFWTDNMGSAQVSFYYIFDLRY